MLTITDIAARVGAEVSFIEYLQRKGILGAQQEPGVYPEEALLRVRWALAGNSLGLDLLQIRAFIELCSYGKKEAFDKYLNDRIIEVDLRLKELRTTRAALEALSYDHRAIRSAAGVAQSVEAQPSWGRYERHTMDPVHSGGERPAMVGKALQSCDATSCDPGGFRPKSINLGPSGPHSS